MTIGRTARLGRTVVALGAVVVLAGCGGTGGSGAGPAGGNGSVPAARPGTSGVVPAPSTSATTSPPAAFDVQSRYAVRFDGARTTVAAAGGATPASTRIPGRYWLPVVVAGQGPEGVSGDGGTLVLQGVHGSDGLSRFALLDTGLATPARTVALKGDFSYDAISPDGRLVFLIQHLPPAGSDHYVVRAYDSATGALREGAIVDKRTPTEAMNGQPLARVATPGGGLVATLYLRRTGEPFVHLLDTIDGFALCADLPEGAVQGWTLAYTPDHFVVRDAQGVDRLTVTPEATVATV